MVERRQGTSDADSLTLDERLRLVSNKHRRMVLMSLLDSESVTEGELPELLGIGSDDGSTFVQLYHLHLPMLEQQGVILWDRQDGTVFRGERYESVAKILETVLEATEDSKAG